MKIFFVLVFCSCGLMAQVKPVEKNGRYVISHKDLYFEVDPKAGGRISSFQIGGKEMLYTDTSNGNNNWGSTFWPAPQSVWGWPPSDTLDKLAYKVSVKGNSLWLASSPTKGKTNCQFEKTFKADEEGKFISITYNIRNTTSNQIDLGPWQITRVPSGGFAFFPTGNTPAQGALLPLLKVENNISWFDYDSAFVSKDPNAVPKLFSDGSKGWLAYVNNEGYLLVFKFADTPPSKKSPGEDEIEFYTNPNLTYTELEPLGPYGKIAPKGTQQWTVKWYAKKLPKSVQAKTGNPDLVHYVEELIK
jgi:hypothetical protein